MYKEDSLTRKLYQFMANNWIVATLIVAIPMIIDFICLFLLDKDNKIMICFVVIVLMVIVIIFTWIRNMAINYDERKRKLTSEYYNGLVDMITLNLNERMETILEIIDNEEYKDEFKDQTDLPHNPFNNQSSRLNPYKHIREYCHSAQNVIRDAFDASQDDIVVSILYRNTIDEDANSDEWNVLYSTYNVIDISPNSIIKNSNSSFNQVKDKPGKMYFKTKANAYEEFHYMQAECEEKIGLLGTIYCHNISLMNKDEVIMPLVINISSFYAPFCDDDDEYAREKAKKLFDILEEHIRYEVTKMILHKQMGLRKSMDKRRGV